MKNTVLKTARTNAEAQTVTLTLQDTMGLESNITIDAALIPAMIAAYASAYRSFPAGKPDDVNLLNVTDFALGFMENGQYILDLTLVGGAKLPMGMEPKTVRRMSAIFQKAAGDEARQDDKPN